MCAQVFSDVHRALDSFVSACEPRLAALVLQHATNDSLARVHGKVNAMVSALQGLKQPSQENNRHLPIAVFMYALAPRRGVADLYREYSVAVEDVGIVGVFTELGPVHSKILRA